MYVDILVGSTTKQSMASILKKKIYIYIYILQYMGGLSVGKHDPDVLKVTPLKPQIKDPHQQKCTRCGGNKSLGVGWGERIKAGTVV